MGKDNAKKDFSAALKAALDAVRHDDLVSYAEEVDAYLDATEPVGDEASFEAVDDAEQAKLSEIAFIRASISPTFH